MNNINLNKNLKKEKNKISKKYITALIAIFSFILLNIYITYNIYNENKIKSEILRLHVVANSNSVSDQITKLKVNENIQNYITSLNLENLSSSEIISILKHNSDKILDIVNQTIKNDNKNYTCTMQIGNIMYDKKEDALNTMDEGIYTSSKIILGKGEGKNIWSFICPNKENISKLQNYESIMPGISKIYNDTHSENISYKSKLLEMFKNL